MRFIMIFIPKRAILKSPGDAWNECLVTCIEAEEDFVAQVYDTVKWKS